MDVLYIIIMMKIWVSFNEPLLLSFYVLNPRWNTFREQPFDFYGGGGGQEDLSEPENLFCLFLEQENFFSPALPAGFFLNLPELFSLNRGGGGGGIQVLHLPEFFQNSFFSKKYFLFTMLKVISQVLCTFGVRKANFGLRKQISDCVRRILECENRFRSAKVKPENFFYLKSEPEFFFCVVFLPP